MNHTVVLVTTDLVLTEEWVVEEAAWSLIEQSGWIATPMLLMWAQQYMRDLACLTNTSP